MYPWGRRAKPFDDPQELLYLRFPATDLDGGEVFAVSMPFPVWCANRGRFSRPRDVLIPNWANWKIAAFPVGSVPKHLSADPEKKKVDGKWQIIERSFSFVPVHLPEPDNYSHSEVHCFEDGNPGAMVKPPQTLRKKFRTMLSEQAQIIE
jgi:hypothetical protein